MIIDYLTVEGVVTPKMLFEPPFTQFHIGGIDGIFEEEKTMAILGILDEINHNAMAA